MRLAFRRLRDGKTAAMLKWRYALLGWLVWTIGKRRIRKKLHLRPS